MNKYSHLSSSNNPSLTMRPSACSGPQWIGDLIAQQAKLYGKQSYGIDTETRVELSFEGLEIFQRELGQLFEASGLMPGMHIALLMPNGIGTLASLLGCMANNYSVNPVNLLCTEDQMHYIIEHSEAHALLVSEEWEARAQVFLKDRPGMALFVMNPHQLQMPVTKKAGQDLVLGPHPSDLALLMYTSGANSQRFGAVTGRIAPNFASQVMPSGLRFWCRSWCKFGARVL